MNRLFLIRIDGCRDGRRNTFAVECEVAGDGQTAVVKRVSDAEHEFLPDEIADLVGKRDIMRAIISAEWERRKPVILKDGRRHGATRSS